MGKNYNNLYFQAIVLYIIVATTIGMYIEYGFKMSLLYAITTSILSSIIYIPFSKQKRIKH